MLPYLLTAWMSFRLVIVGGSVASISIQFRLHLRGARDPLPYWRSRFAVGATQRRAGHLASWAMSLPNGTSDEGGTDSIGNGALGSGRTALLHMDTRVRHQDFLPKI